MKYFVDTEFNEFQGELISIGIVAEDGRWFYHEAVRRESDKSWVAVHVIPLLDGRRSSREAMQADLRHFLDGDPYPEFIADWPTDLAFLADLLTLPGGERLGPESITFSLVSHVSAVPTTPHHALSDALALKVGYVRKFG